MLKRLLLLAALIPVIALPVSAQVQVQPPAQVAPPETRIHGVAATFPTNDAVIKRIYAVGMDSSWTKQLAHSLLDSIGPRLFGTPGLEHAQDWVVAMYKSWGIDAKRENFGTWRGWRRGYSHIDLIFPRERTLSGTMAGYSPGTGKKDVDAEVIIMPYFADTITAFRKWLPSVKGKLVMVSPAMPTCRLPDEIKLFGTAFTDSSYAIDRQGAGLTMQRSIQGTGLAIALGGGTLGMALDSAGAAGVITSRPKQNSGLAMEVFETYNTRSPTIALTCEDYGLVYRLAEHGTKPVIRMNLDAQLLGEVPVGNAIGMIKGTTRPDEYVVLSAHYDSWDAASGATDNGTGSLTMMEAMRILKKAYPNPKRTIIVGHWSGEENGLVGSQAWAHDHPEVIKGMQGLINQDGGTGRVQNISGGGINATATHVPIWLAKMPNEFQANFKFAGIGVPGVGGSDHSSFACFGVPTFGMGGVGWNYGNLTWHTEKDTYDKVVFDDLKFNATVVAMLAYLASEDPQLIPREKAILPPPRPRPGEAQSTTPAPWPSCPAAVRKTNPRLR